MIDGDVLPTSAMSDLAALVARAQRGDREAFDALYEQFWQRVYDHVCRRMHSTAHAHDLTQDVFLKAWLALPRTSPQTLLHVQAWLFRIATNVCLDELRHRKLVKWQPWGEFVSAFHPSQIAGDQPDREAMRDETGAEVRAILGKLRPNYRMALVLHHYHQCSYTDIAYVLHTTRAAVKSLIFRGREQFRQIARCSGNRAVLEALR